MFLVKKLFQKLGLNLIIGMTLGCIHCLLLVILQLWMAPA
jgi:hypothetical protein